MTYRAKVKSLDLIAYWRLGSTADESGNGHTLTAVGGVAAGGSAGLLTGDPDPATDFDGVDDEFRVATLPAVGPARTLMAVVKPDSMASTRDALSSGSTQAYLRLVSTGALRMGWRDSAGNARTLDGGTLTAGATAFILGTHDGTTARLYIDGVEVGSSAAFDAGQITAAATWELAGLAAGAGLDGVMDECAIWDRALNPTEIAALYQEGINPSPPKATWRTFIDWDGTGFEELPRYDMLTFDWQRGAGPDLGSQSPGSALLVLENVDGRYTDTNPASDLVGRLKPNARVWQCCDYDTDLFGVWSGYLDELAPVPQLSHAQAPCSDLLSRLAEIDVDIEPVAGRTYGEYREAILLAAGVAAGELDLDDEFDVMADTRDYGSGKALALLEAINEATGTRHFMRAGNLAATWQQYVSVNAFHKLAQAAVDVEINDRQHIEKGSFGGWRTAWKTVINRQRVGIERPPLYADEAEEVWAQPFLPLAVPAGTTRKVWASQIGPVADAALVITGTNIASSILTMFADSALIEITAGASDAAVSALSITGRPGSSAGRGVLTAENAASQAEFGTQDGPDRTAVGTSPDMAQGLAEHLVWRYGDPRKQPRAMQVNEFATALGRDLFDLVGFTFEHALSVTDQRMEIVGEKGEVSSGIVDITWQLQDTPEQSPLTNWVFTEGAFTDSDYMTFIG